MFLMASRWFGTGSAIVNFHPALEDWLDAYGCIHALQVGVLDVLEHGGPIILEYLLVGDTATWGVWLAAQALDDLARFFENALLIDFVEVPACRPRLLGKFAALLVQRGKREAEENAMGSLGR